MIDYSESINLLRRTLGYRIDREGPYSLDILITEICEDNTEKAALLQRVSVYLDKLEAITQQRKATTDQLTQLREKLIKSPMGALID